MFLVLPTSTAFYWIRHDLTFGIFVPIGMTVIVYLAVKNLREMAQEPAIKRSGVVPMAALGYGVLVVALGFAVPADFFRPTALPGYMLNEKGRAQGAALRVSLGLVPNASGRLARDSDYSDPANWPLRGAAPDAKDAGEPIQIDALDDWPSSQGTSRIECQWPITNVHMRVPAGVSPSWFLDVCSYFKTWRMTSLPTPGDGRYTAMVKANLAINYLVFAVAAGVLIHFMVMLRLPHGTGSQIIWRALVILVVAGIWLPLRYYAESYINFMAPRPISMAGYPAYVSVAVALFIATVFVAMQCLSIKQKLWAQIAMTGAVNVITWFVIAVPDAATMVSASVARWPDGQFWMFIILVIFFVAGLMVARAPQPD